MIPHCKKSRQVHRNDQRKEKKTIHAQEIAEREVYLKLKCLIRTVLSEEILTKIAKKSHLLHRKRKLTPMALVGVLMIGCTNCSEDVPVSSLNTMCSYLRKWFNIRMKPQSLQTSINRKETALFIKEIMSHVMAYEIDKLLQKRMKTRRQTLRMFDRILIQDSTVISLPATLSRIFKGCGGSGSEAAVKIDYIVDIAQHFILRIKYLSGKIPDASLSGDIIDHLHENDLVLRDLGYFNLAHFAKMKCKNAFFISRLSKSVGVYLNKTDVDPVDIILHLEMIGVKKKSVDIDVFLGKKERMPVRLIGVKVPPDVVEVRRRQYKRARGRSQEPSESLKEWHGYTLMVTNLSRKQAPLVNILRMYKIRWQIELIFKNMKSIFAVDKLTGENKHRVFCLVLIKLTVTLIASFLYAYAQTRVEKGKEISLFKFARWLKDIGGLKNAFALRDLTSLLEELESDLDLLCKRKGKVKEIEDEAIDYVA